MLSPFAKGCGSEVTTDLAELPLFAGASNAQENLPLGSDSSVAGGDSQDIQREGEEARDTGERAHAEHAHHRRADTAEKAERS